MARVTLTRTSILGPYPTLQPSATTLNLTETAADASNLNQFVLDGPCILIAHNIGVGARTFTLTSVVDARNRTGDVTAYSVGAGLVAAFKLDQTEGWRQTDGYMYLTGSHAEMLFSIIRLG